MRRPFCLLLACALIAPGEAPAQCKAATSGPPPRVIELYTSEGCESCPPVDRWLSLFKGKTDVLPLAFHVDYFDHLGWKDRFASAANTRRQKELSETNGSRFIYTPQVLIDGQDRKDWVAAKSPPAATSPVEIGIERKGDKFEAVVHSFSAKPLQLSAYWAVTENDHTSQVSAGENKGALLHHDFVVRDYRKVRPWELAPGASTSFSYEPMISAKADRLRDVSLVVSDSGTGRPMQALRLGGC